MALIESCYCILYKQDLARALSCIRSYDLEMYGSQSLRSQASAETMHKTNGLFALTERNMQYFDYTTKRPFFKEKSALSRSVTALFVIVPCIFLHHALY